jgi:hypothetical protein
LDVPTDNCIVPDCGGVKEKNLRSSWSRDKLEKAVARPVAVVAGVKLGSLMMTAGMSRSSSGSAHGRRWSLV